MGIVAKYKFNQTIYENFIPTFNGDFTDYTITDEIDTDGYTIRTIESNSLPTSIKFGYSDKTPENDILCLKEINYLNISNITDLSDLCSSCQNLTKVNTENWDTSQVTSMYTMFYNCPSLTSLDVSKFDTSKVTNMKHIFSSCSSLTSLDVSNFDTSQVTDMYAMFNGCFKLTSLDVSNFNTSNVTDMTYMFSHCSSLTSLDVSNFDTSQVTNMSSMFHNCSSLTSLDVSNFDTSQVTSMQNMFYGCSSLTSLDVSNFNTSQVTSMYQTFYNCSSLTSLPVSKFNTGKVTTMYNMFFRCSSLTSLDVSNFNTNKVSGSGMVGMFAFCSLLTSLDISSFNTSEVVNMSNMFYNCSSLTLLDLSNFDTSKVTDMSFMFNGCSSLTLLDLSNFNTGKVTNMNYMFYNCSSLTSLDVSNFDTSQVTNMSSMFGGCSKLVNIGIIYCSSSTINKISDLITTNTTIWYSDAKLEDLTKKENITYKEYKMNILESDEEINLRRIGDVYDELNLETGELTQRIKEVILDGDETWTYNPNGLTNTYDYYYATNKKNHDYTTMIPKIKMEEDKFGIVTTVYNDSNVAIRIEKDKLSSLSFNQWLSQNPITIQHQLATPVIKTINLKGKPSINWQGDTYLHLENNTLYPQLDCEIESINYYEIPKLKANTLYTLRYVGEPRECIFGGLTYRTENNMILTSGSSDNLLYFDKEVRKVVLIEGDVRDRNFDYFEGIESLGTVEIVTHKTNMPIFAKGGRK